MPLLAPTLLLKASRFSFSCLTASSSLFDVLIMIFCHEEPSSAIRFSVRLQSSSRLSHLLIMPFLMLPILFFKPILAFLHPNPLFLKQSPQISAFSPISPLSAVLSSFHTAFRSLPIPLPQTYLALLALPSRKSDFGEGLRGL